MSGWPDDRQCDFDRGAAGNAVSPDGGSASNPDDAAHTFSVPDLDINVPMPGVDANAKNQCAVAPCTLAEAHNTITFSFVSPGPGSYRWQCFVPCALAFLYGNGGPMQTIGYMDGLIEVS